MDSPVVWFILILGADLTAMVLMEVYRWYKKAPDIKCDFCGKVKDLTRTHDLQYWACRACRKRYKEEVQ